MIDAHDAHKTFSEAQSECSSISNKALILLADHQAFEIPIVYTLFHFRKKKNQRIPEVQVLQIKYIRKAFICINCVHIVCCNLNCVNAIECILEFVSIVVLVFTF